MEETVLELIGEELESETEIEETIVENTEVPIYDSVLSSVDMKLDSIQHMELTIVLALVLIFGAIVCLILTRMKR